MSDEEIMLYALNSIVEQLKELNKNFAEFFKSKHTPPEKQVSTKKKTTVETLITLDVDDLEIAKNSYLIKNGKGKIAFIGHSLVDKIESLPNGKQRLYFTKEAQKWFTSDRIQWKEDEK